MSRSLILCVELPLPDTMPGVLPGYATRPCCRSDIAGLGRVYYTAYDPGVACDTVDEAVADIQAAFDGAYGELWTDAPLVTVAPDGQIAGAIQIVRQAPWDDTPPGPFIIELFTARNHRRVGLASALLRRAASIVSDAGGRTMALRVDEGNEPALALYRQLGFREWTGDGRNSLR